MFESIEAELPEHEAMRTAYDQLVFLLRKSSDELRSLVSIAAHDAQYDDDVKGLVGYRSELLMLSLNYRLLLCDASSSTLLTPTTRAEDTAANGNARDFVLTDFRKPNKVWWLQLKTNLGKYTSAANTAPYSDLIYLIGMDDEIIPTGINGGQTYLSIALSKELYGIATQSELNLIDTTCRNLKQRLEEIIDQPASQLSHHTK
jgi:hypothetical protein